VRDVEVEVAVVVGVEERAAGAPARGRDSRLRRFVDEAAPPVVAEEVVAAEVRDVEVEAAVVVVVARADAVAPGRGVDTGAGRDVLEPPAAEVAEEGIAVRDRLAGGAELVGVHEVDVLPSVAVVVEDRDAAAR
jgi:hypothetical protein